ncbi:50S ribosomal protein L23, partial [Candidatus Woesearchaeota archaeon]|nr:50S ribosomal protein L23 [Candidatus Woesearchaeota archaeon]
VDPNSTKREVKASLEKMFQVKIVAVATLRGSDGRKRAYVQFGKETPAIDIATRLGLL